MQQPKSLIHAIFMWLLFSGQALAADPPASAVAYGDNPAAGHYASLNGINMYYEVYGGGQPLLLIHGNGDSIAAMGGQIPYFAQHYQVIAADSRGHGKSGQGAQALSYLQMMEDYNALLDALNISKAYVLGWSDGGILSLLLAIHHADKVGKMAIMGANLRPGDGAINDWVPGLLQPVSDAVDAQLAAKDTSGDWPLQRQLLDLLMTQPDITDVQLQTIKAPVLVMAGDRDIIRAEHTLEIYRNLPKAHLAILPGQTHWAPADDSDEFNALVGRFFANPFTRPSSEEILRRELASPAR